MSNELAQAVEELHAEQQTGLLLIHLGDQMATVGLVSGEIVCWFFDRLTGSDAVAAFRTARRAQQSPLKWRFRLGPVVSGTQDGIPPFADIRVALSDATQ